MIESCERDGSTDAKIIASSIAVNDFDSFLVKHDDIRRIYLNGAAAERNFTRRVALPIRSHPTLVRRLPSTSPANTTATYERKRAAWRVVR